MADFAIIENGVVVNRVMAPSGYSGGVECAPEVGVGWAYLDGTFVAPESAPPDPGLTPPLERVSARQFKLQLLADGIYEQVEAYVGAQPLAVRIAYENSATFYRNDEMLLAGFAALGKTEADIDAFFAAARGI